MPHIIQLSKDKVIYIILAFIKLLPFNIKICLTVLLYNMSARFFSNYLYLDNIHNCKSVTACNLVLKYLIIICLEFLNNNINYPNVK